MFLFWLALSFIFMALAEYFIHRDWMHKPFFDRLSKFGWVYTHHAVEHHGKNRNDINIDLPVKLHFMLGSPVLLIFFLIGGFQAILALSLIFLFHSYAWTKIHRAIHELEDNWVGRLPFFWFFKDHHLKHHEIPNKNYAVVFIFTDYIFGTKL